MSLEKLATIVSSTTALILLLIKLFVWIISSSISVLSSAIDSLLDLFVSIFNYFAIKNSEKPADSKFNYGRGKIEALASLFEWIIITLSWFYIMYESISKLINKEQVSYLHNAIIVMIISLLITWWLVSFLNRVAKKTDNLVIKSDALHYKTDLYNNSWILLALWLIYFTGLYFIDAVVWIIIAIYIVYSAFDLIQKWILLIMDISLAKNEVEQIKKIINSKENVASHHFLKTRSSWKFNFVDVHIVFNTKIKLFDAHSVSDEIEDEIRKINPQKEWIFNIHLDPYDDSAEAKNKSAVFYNNA